MANTKFQHNADNLLQLTKLQASKNPRNFIADELPAYRKSSKKMFVKRLDIFTLQVNETEITTTIR